MKTSDCEEGARLEERHPFLPVTGIILACLVVSFVFLFSAIMVHERWFEDRDTKTTDVSEDDLNTAIIRSIVFSPEERLSIDDHLQEMRRRTQRPYEAAIKISPREFPIRNVSIVCAWKDGELDILRREQPGPVPFYNQIQGGKPGLLETISSVCQKALRKRG